MSFWDWLRQHLTVKDILATMAVLYTIQLFIKEVFGVNMVGKRIYKGAPMIWKMLMRRSIFRKDIQNKIDRILKEVEFNGGESLKDAVKRIEHNQVLFNEMLKELKMDVDFNSMRLSIDDEMSDRMLFRLDKTGACTFVNDTFLKIFGYTWSDVEKFRWEDIIHPDDLSEVREKWKRAIENKDRYSNEQRIITHLGEEKLCQVTGYPVLYADGSLRGFYGTVDIL